MRLLTSLTFTACFASGLYLFDTVSRAADGDSKKTKSPTMSALEKAIVELTNKERAKQNLPPLKPNAQLIEAARKHSANMVKQSKLAHVLDGKTHTDRMKGAGYSAPGLENCAMGFRSAEQAVAKWMSDNHRDAILCKDATEIGVGVAFSAKGVPYITQDFGNGKLEPTK